MSCFESVLEQVVRIAMNNSVCLFYCTVRKAVKWVKYRGKYHKHWGIMEWIMPITSNVAGTANQKCMHTTVTLFPAQKKIVSPFFK